jgi:hypothetical protein
MLLWSGFLKIRIFSLTFLLTFAGRSGLLRGVAWRCGGNIAQAPAPRNNKNPNPKTRKAQP